MQQFSLKYLYCVKCHSNLDIQVLKEDEQIQEGFLDCKNCGLGFPIINETAILWNDFASYLSNRPNLGGILFCEAKTEFMKQFVKTTLRNLRKNPQDISKIEKRWCDIYLQNKKARFYSKIKQNISKQNGIALDHGCSVGIITSHLAKNYDFAFGIDKSYFAIQQAKKTAKKNTDFFVSNSLEHPFGKTWFDIVLALNLFELVEPINLVNVLMSQIKKGGMLILSDPYDYDRGQKSIKKPLDARSLRHTLKEYGFKIIHKTSQPSYIPWHLQLNERASLNYLVDIIVAKLK